MTSDPKIMQERRRRTERLAARVFVNIYPLIPQINAQRWAELEASAAAERED